jgi:hypothetical protein
MPASVAGSRLPPWPARTGYGLSWNKEQVGRCAMA